MYASLVSDATTGALICLRPDESLKALLHCTACSTGDWLREAAARAKALIESAQAKRNTAEKRPAFQQAAVLLIEAAAGAAKRQAAAAVAAGGPGGPGAKLGEAGGPVAPVVTAEEWKEWLSVAAGVLGGPLERWAEAVGLYCQVRE